MASPVAGQPASPRPMSPTSVTSAHQQRHQLTSSPEPMERDEVNELNQREKDVRKESTKKSGTGRSAGGRSYLHPFLRPRTHSRSLLGHSLSYPPRNRDLEADLSELEKKVQNYKLPAVVHASLNSWTKGANSLAIITALFAGVQVSLLQMIVNAPGDTTAWRVLEWFTYAGVLTDLGGTASAIAVVNMASCAPINARTRAITCPESLPRRLLENKSKRKHKTVEGGGDEPGQGNNEDENKRGEGNTITEIDFGLLLSANEMELLNEFGMSKRFPIVGWHMLLSFLFGSLFIFTSISIWVWLNEPRAVAIALMPVVVLTIWPVIYTVYTD